MTLTKKTYAGLDWFRLIAAVLVVTIHTSPLLDISGTADFVLTRILARTAVPFFFMASGFFLFPKTEDGGPRPGRLAPFLKKTALLYLAAIIFYLPVNIYAGTWENWRHLPRLLSDIVFNGTFYHLWYLPAALIGAALVWLLLKKMKPGHALAVCFVLYAVGLLGDSYYGLAEQVPVLGAVYGALFSVFDYTRNGLFFAPVFFVMGALIARRPAALKLGTSLWGLGVSLALLLAEGLLLHRFGLQRHDSMYVLLLPCMYFLFTALLSWNGKSRKSLRNVSMLVYLSHPAVIVAVRGFADVTNLQKLLIDNSVVHFLAVLAGAFAVSLAAAALMRKLRKKSAPVCNDRAWAEIDFKNLQHNVLALRGVLSEHCGIMAVVKAEAYGHGGVETGKCLNRIGVRDIAVAALDEGIRLRREGVVGNILVLGYTAPSQARALRRYRLTQTVVDAAYAAELNGYGKPLMVHIKVNTGMNRLGEEYANVSGVTSIFGLKNLSVNGIYTHLCVSDSMADDDVAFTNRQLSRFYSLIDALKDAHIQIPKIHIQSSYGVLNYPHLQCDFARIGLALYGVLSRPGDKTLLAPELKPVLSLKSTVALVRTVDPGESVSYGRDFTARRESKIAVVPIGFADGVPRSLSTGIGAVLVRGCRAPIAGRICMDQLMVDVTEIPDVKRGDVVTLIGTDGAEEIRAEQVSEDAGTITNELLSRLGGRLQRLYIHE